MEGKPDLIIGNYTDGNLAASLMASKLKITQVTIFLLKHRITKILLFNNFCDFLRMFFLVHELINEIA
jgi:hypothetical protein